MAGVRHALIGGFALAVHGVHRATQDIDFLADGAKKDDIVKALNAAGFVLRHSTTEVLQFGGVGFLDVLLANRPLSLTMLEDAKEHTPLSVRVLRIEDLIGLKIQAYSNDPSREYQDKADIQNLLGKHPNLDWNRIQKYADLFGQWETVQDLRSKS